MSKSPQQVTREWTDIFMHRSMRSWHQFVKSTGLSMPQLFILIQLQHKGGCGVSEISERFGTTSAAASQLVDKLVQAGYLERTEDPSDRRAKILHLSSSGRLLVERGFQERYHWMDELAKNLSTEQKAKVYEALAIMIEAVKRLEEDNSVLKVSHAAT